MKIILIYILSVNEKLPVSPIQYSVLWHRVPCITAMENDIHHIRMHYTHSLPDPTSFHCIVLEHAQFWCYLKVWSSFFVLNGIIQFFNETSRACTGMLSSENDDFKFLKTAKTIKSAWVRCTVVPGLVELFISTNQSVVDQKHGPKSSHKAVLYIFKNIEF